MNYKNFIPALMVIAILPASCRTTPPLNTPVERIAGEQTVHCLLPARVQRLGNVVYPARRQLVFESETRCTLRGGEYTVYDRGSAESSAEFYRGPAEAGNAEAQYSLALVYESLFTPPRYQEAAHWYQQAVNQGHADAMKNLAYLYEQGLGVQPDSLLAIDLLRQSGGITDELVLASEMDQAMSEAAAEIRGLTESLEAQNQRTAELQSALAQSNRQVIDRRQQLQKARGELEKLRTDTAELGRKLPQQLTAADRGRLEQLNRDLASRETQVTEQELLIASLEADLAATSAQLDASERRADLQEQRLQSQLANAEEQAVENVELQRALAARDGEITTLNAAVGGLRDRLGSEQQQNRQLLQEMQQLSGKLSTSRQQSDALQSLLSTLSDREQTIEEQARRIQELRQSQQTAGASEIQVQQLEAQLADLRDALQSQRVGYSQLEQQLQNARSAALVGQEQANEVERLLVKIASRDETIADQETLIDQLESLTAQTRTSLAELEVQYSTSTQELDLVKARLIATETELVKARSELVKVQGQLAAEQQSETQLASEINALRQQLESIQSSSDQRVADLQEQLRHNNERLASRNETIQNLQDEIEERQNAVAEAEQRRQLALRNIPTTAFPELPGFTLPSGTRRALVIGNDTYLDNNIQDLTTAVTGASEMAEMLESKYGFETTLLINATRREIMYAFSELQSIQGEDDYVLIYYAGHGARSSRDDSITYWLPVEAQANELSFEADGIKSDWITNELRAMKARHVMIIADSCYAGAMVRPPRISVAEKDVSPRLLEYFANRRSRTVLSSGGDSPVLDESIDGRHSVFTKALLELLESNSGIIYGEALHAALMQSVRFNAEQLNFTQIPLFSEIAAANHGNGQFVLSAAGS